MTRPSRAKDWTRLAIDTYQGLSEGDFLHNLTVKMERSVGIGMMQWTTLDRATMMPLVTQWSTPTPRSLMTEYEQHIYPHDPRIPAAMRHHGGFRPCWSLVDETFERSAVVQEWADRKDVDRRWSAISVWNIDERLMAIIAFLRSRKEGPIQLDELKPVKHLRNHMRRAAQLHYLFRNQSGGALFDRAWGSRSQSVFLLGRERRLLAANDSAEHLLREGDVFQKRWGEVTARAPRLAQTLDHALAAARCFDLTIAPRSITFGWPRWHGQATLQVEVMALPGVAAETGLGERVEAILLCRDVPHRPHTHLIR